MRAITKKLAKWFSIESEEGVTALEYGLIAALVAVAIIVALGTLGTNLAGMFEFVAGKIKTG